MEIAKSTAESWEHFLMAILQFPLTVKEFHGRHSMTLLYSQNNFPPAGKRYLAGRYFTILKIKMK